MFRWNEAFIMIRIRQYIGQVFFIPINIYSIQKIFLSYEPFQVFTFACGKPRTTTRGLQEMACSNRGNFLKVGELNDVNSKTFEFFKMVNKNSNNGRLASNHNSIHPPQSYCHMITLMVWFMLMCNLTTPGPGSTLSGVMRIWRRSPLPIFFGGGLFNHIDPPQSYCISCYSSAKLLQNVLIGVLFLASVKILSLSH